MKISPDFREFVAFANDHDVQDRGSFLVLTDLKANKQASGRHQDLADLENLE